MCGALIGAESDLESTTSQVYTSSRPSTALLGPGTASNTRPAEAVAYPNTTSHTEYAMSQRIPFPSGPAPRNSTTAGAAADNVPREDMFGVWPEMMSGGLSAYQQFQSVFAPEARAIKNRLELPLSHLEISASIWMALKILNLRRREAALASVKDIRLGSKPSASEEAMYHPPAYGQYAIEDYVLVKRSNGDWNHGWVIDVEANGTVLVTLGVVHGAGGDEELQYVVPAAERSTKLRARKAPAQNRRITQLYDDLKKAVNEEPKAPGDFAFYRALEDRAGERKTQKAELEQNGGDEHIKNLLRANIESLEMELQRERVRFNSRTAELKTYNANLVKMRSGLLKYLDRDTPEAGEARAAYRQTHAEAHDVAAAVHAHAGRMSDLRTALRERQEELAILGRGGAATGAAGGGGARATASGGAGGTVRKRAGPGNGSGKAKKGRTGGVNMAG